MRIRFTIDIQRREPPTQDYDHGTEYVPSAQIEHAGPQTIGFTAQPGRPTQPEDHR